MQMPKNSGENMKPVRLAPKPQPSRPILHGWAPPVGPKVEPGSMAAPKQADRLKPSSPKKSPAGGKMKPQMVF
jgi:hypothetical protein